MARKTTKTYGQLKQDLEAIIQQLQDESTDIDKALELHQSASNILAELETYLKKTKHQLEVIKKSK